MRFYVAVLIAAVTVNCLVTTINAVAASDTVEVPYIDMLLPPLEDVQDNSKDAPAKINVTVKATPAPIKTTTTTKATTTTTTKKPITNEVNNILPELSIEALLPPLFEAKIDKEETIKSTTTPTTTTTTTRRPTTTTTKTTTTTTAKPLTTTTTTTVKPSKIKVPDLFLDSLLPPLLDNEIVDAKENKVVVTTQKPIAAVKTTKKSYYQQQKDLLVNDQPEAHTKNYQKQQLQHSKHLTSSNTDKNTKNYNKPIATTTAFTTTNDKHVAESKTLSKQVSLATQTSSIKLQSKIETIAQQHVTKQVSQHKHSNGNSQANNKQFNNYSFDLYFGSTTPRPPKSGLPTITPFPHRLGR
ncbi:salivary glue protein Sgs-3-like [Lucilia cuprina]|uniref:salivary glue protein Sgs-3-like n=1 Tax=Lucilia cuprina TaxID=7375 RepID=UPI001F06FF6F|nr:salivary glue protein Sgs-3-like [Lucilia cuprina]